MNKKSIKNIVHGSLIFGGFLGTAAQMQGTSSALHKALQQKNWTEAEQLLDEGATVDQSMLKFATHHLTNNNTTSECQKVCERVMELIEKQKKQQRTQDLYKALQENNWTEAEQLLDEGATVDQSMLKFATHHLTNNNACAHVMELIEQRQRQQRTEEFFDLLDEDSIDEDRVWALVQAGIDVNAKRNGRTPLSAAMAYLECFAPIAKRLVEDGADVNAKQPRDPSPLCLAVDRLTPDMALIDLLLEHGADPNLGPTRRWKRVPSALAVVVEAIWNRQLGKQGASEYTTIPLDDNQVNRFKEIYKKFTGKDYNPDEVYEEIMNS